MFKKIRKFNFILKFCVNIVCSAMALITNKSVPLCGPVFLYNITLAQVFSTFPEYCRMRKFIPRFSKNPSIFRALNILIPFHIIQPYFLRSILILSFYLSSKFPASPAASTLVLELSTTCRPNITSFKMLDSIHIDLPSSCICLPSKKPQAGCTLV